MRKIGRVRKPTIGSYLEARTPYIIQAALQDVDLTLRTTERRHIQGVLDLVGGNISVAAKMLGVPRRTLQRKMRRT